MAPNAAAPTHLHDLFYQYFYALPLVGLLTYVVYQRCLSPLAGIPGPFLASLTNFWMVRSMSRGDLNVYLKQLHDKYGATLRIGPNEVSVTDLAAFRIIYGSASKFKKGRWYEVIKGHREFDIFGVQDIKTHTQQRKLTARAYTMESLKDLEPYVDNAIEVFMGKMKEQIDKKIDMGYWIQLFAFDVIGEITWSKSFDYMSRANDFGTFKAVAGIIESAAWLGYVPWLFWAHDCLMPLIGNWFAVNNRHGSIRDFALRETEARKVKPAEKKDIIGRLLDTHAQKPGEFPYSSVISMGATNVTAGSDTTAVTTRAVLYHLLRNPSTKQKLVAEIDDLRRRGQLSNPVRWSEANNMKYLQAVLYEGTRIHPAVGMNLPRVVPEGGIDINGTYIPAGYTVSTSAWVLHRNTDVFGPDAAEYNPERWLQDDVGDMHRYLFSFGSGARSCIGKNISWLEMSKLIPTLFLRYDVELWDGKPWTEECLYVLPDEVEGLK
ncbi:cytochrome P450 [Polyplosphaeria fusca]|uniref:Cytochrome P450 n=1 Tax=Polyplosphaeria fusca TaxID=682080 RepID=A0A9P4RAL2_9PLEO|nr:cytochrome P450 [Polyplosphaeria fusca]